MFPEKCSRLTMHEPKLHEAPNTMHGLHTILTEKEELSDPNGI